MRTKKVWYWLAILLTALIAVSLIGGGCAAPAPQPAPAPAPAPSPAPAPAPAPSPTAKPAPAPAPAPVPAPAKTIRWTVLTTLTRGGTSYPIQQKWLDTITERSGGILKFNVQSQTELGYSSAELPDVCGRGLVQITHNLPVWQSGQYPIVNGANLPFLFAENNIKNVAPIAHAFTKKFYEEHYKVMQVLPWFTVTHLAATKRVQHPQDMKGMKIRAASPDIADVLKKIAVVPASLPFPEIYTALQTGVIDGNSSVLSVVVENKFYEVTKFVAISNTAPTQFAYLINREAFSALPKDIQDIVLKASEEIQPAMQQDYMLKNEHLEFLKGKGVTIDYWTDADMAYMREQAAPVYDSWVKKAGSGAKEYLDSILKVLQK